MHFDRERKLRRCKNEKGNYLPSTCMGNDKDEGLIDKKIGKRSCCHPQCVLLSYIEGTYKNASKNYVLDGLTEALVD